jgi:hypothetical protein
LREEAMKERSEYQQLEEVLRKERAGSPKIRALAHWLMQENVRFKMSQPKTPSEERKLITEEAIIEYRIWFEGFSAEVIEYTEAYEHAFELLQPFVNKFIDEGKLDILLVYLREINREKSKK